MLSDQERTLRAQKRRRLWQKYFWRRVGILSLLAAVLCAASVGAVALVAALIDGDDASVPLESDTPPTLVTEPVEEAVDLYPKADGDTVTLGSEVDAQYAVLVDLTDNRIVAQKGADVRAYPASITKMMTLLVAVENTTDFSETYEMSYTFINGLVEQGASRAGFVSGEKVSVTDMLYGCILPSGADATIGLANHLAGSEEDFVVWMNQRAEEMGLKDTHFENTSGLHHSNHYTTAMDMAVILAEAMKDPTCRKVLSTYQYTTAKTEQNPEGLLLTSTLFSRMKGDEPEGATVIGGKTGYTAQAMHTMASYAEGEDGHRYVFVTMCGSNRWKATYDCIEVLSRFCGGVPTDPVE